MGFLPPNQKVKRNLSNRLSVWVMGEPGVGKTYFASTWKNAFMINTDGNYTQFDTPSVFVSEVMKVNGQTMHGFDYIEKLIDEFIAQKGQANGYETLVIDLLEDVYQLCDKMIAKQNGKEFAQDLPWGKGNKLVAERMRNLLTKLNSIDMNIVYLSHVVQQTSKDINGNDITQYVPKNLKPEMIATISGRTQLTCILEIVEMNQMDKNGNLILDKQGKPVRESYRILNWEKSERNPATVIRFKTNTNYCLATYDDLIETIVK